MNRVALVVVLAALAAAGLAHPQESVAPADSAPAFTPVPAPTDTSIVFVIETGSRLYPDWKEQHETRLHAPFYIGDTPYTAVVTDFFPDFKIVDRRAVNASAGMENPAAHVFVRADSGVVDSAWAFLNFPPHYSPRSFFTFQLKEVIGYGAPAAPPAKED